MFRPLPGAADASVEYTVTIKDRFTADVYWDGLACEGADKFNINQSASLQRNCYGRMMMSRRI